MEPTKNITQHKYFIPALVAALFLVLMLCCCASAATSIYILNSETQLEEVDPPPAVEEEPPIEEKSPIESAVLEPVLLNFSNVDEVLKDYQFDIPEIESVEDIEEIYGFKYPTVYLFDAPYPENHGLEENYNLHGMSYLVDKSMAPAPFGSVIARSEYFCQLCENNMNKYHNFVQYRTDLGVTGSTETPPFQITYFKYHAFYGRSLEWVTEQSLIQTRANKIWGESNDFYMLGVINVEDSKFEKLYIYLEMLDDDGVPDEETVYVIDYAIEDQYGQKFRHTIRATEETLVGESDKIAALIGSFDTTEKYFIFGNEPDDLESRQEYEHRMEYEVEYWNDQCALEYGTVCPHPIHKGMTNEELLESVNKRWLNYYNSQQ
ncbi:MAG: hypothetical protein QY318_00535 [Candidatus Dojkabacteria bacterium]|nr:MAG: hypothetical protein QY318_00535 [Candidatus Dojkabacteria bacterium]